MIGPATTMISMKSTARNATSRGRMAAALLCLALVFTTAMAEEAKPAVSAVRPAAASKLLAG